MMHKNQKDRQFSNSTKGQNTEENYWEDTSSQAQTQSDRTDDDADSNVKVGRQSERYPMIMEEYERSRLQATAKNHVLYSINEEDESAEEDDLDLDEEYLDEDDLDEDDLDEDDETDPRDFDNELLELGDSPDADSDGYRSDER